MASVCLILLNLAPETTGFYVIGAILVALLLFMSGMVSGSEVAFFSLSPKDRQALDENPSRSAAKVLHLLSSPEKLLATILVANNFINIAIVIFTTYLTGGLFAFIFNTLVRLLIQLVFVTALLLLFGELMPKILAGKYPLRFALSMAHPIAFAHSLFRPVVYLLTTSTRFIQHRLQRRTKQNLSIDDLSHAIELASGELNEEKEMLEGIINFTNIEVKAIMKPRMDVVVLEYSYSFTKVLAVIVDTGYSRIPVFRDNTDNIIGVLYIKDLLPYVNIEDKKSFKWQKLIRTHYVVPETKKINELLKDFQAKKMHMAVVVDEYGGTSGIVTLEDILEEIVGDITDESDTDNNLFQQNEKGQWEFDGRTHINDFCRVFDIDIEAFDNIRGESDTLAGLIIEVKGVIPAKHEKIVLSDFTFTILSADNRKIKKILVERIQQK